MSLPPVLRYVYNHGSEEVIRRGKKIFYSGGVQMLDVDHLLEQVRFRVRNDVYQNYYTVTVNKFLDTKNLTVRCQCPYNMGDICRHEVGALFQLNDILQSGFFENADIVYDQKHSIVRMRQVTMQMLRVFASPEIIDKAILWAASKKVIVTKGKSDRIEAEVADGDQTYKVVLKQNEERYFDTSCGCEEKNYPLCVHKATLFIHILNAHGPQYFQTVRDWDEQKNKLLALYGYSLNDDLTNKFEFTYKDGKPFLRVLDTSIQKIQRPADSAIVHREQVKIAPQVAVENEKPAVEVKRLGIVLDPYADLYPNVNVMLVAGLADEDGRKFLNGIDVLELAQYIDPLQFHNDERELLPIARKFQPEETLRFLKKNLPFGDFIDDIDVMFKEHPTEDVTEQMWEYLLPKYQKLLERYKDHDLCFIKNNVRRISSKDIEPVAFAPVKAVPQLSVTKQGNTYHIELAWIINDKYVAFKDVQQLNAALLMHDYTVYAIASIAQVKLVEQFLPDGELIIDEQQWPAFLADKLMQWSQIVHVNFGDELIEHIDQVMPAYRLYLREREQILVMQPAFVYNSLEIQWGFFGDVIEPHNGVVKVIRRNEAAEQEYINMLRTLHSDIQQNIKEHYFYLPATAVLANNWFFRFADVMKEWNVELFGFSDLKTLRISTYKPETRIQVSSGIDWFDATVEVMFGEQMVSLIDVKRALSQKQNFVKLDDGSVGLLPEEWIKKYALLIKMGENKGGKIRLKKYHFSVLDELLNEVDEEDLQRELEQKKERLTDIIEHDFSNIKPPSQLQATLRPYQQAGFQWLLFLKEAGWGGILADDMGLGKTVQALTLFQHYKNEHAEAKFLVVCPTTLMYNWENEIKKFTPGLTHLIHHGPKRLASQKTFDPFDIIITTYGTMRSDIKVFKEIYFDYALLDESQSIKNPQSQVAKASLLLHCKHRLALSGTPVQNNTFDLFAQMNFLNPGMLGSREFFMNEFATPIDKFQEDEVKQQLRKITYPFLLRRTKEQVAKDLPEKTETVLYCELGDEQRKIYDAYRNMYREQIMGMIEERGVERSTMHILQGLTRLRQICDSPAILNEAERFHNYSVKLDELTREINENVGNHKALIFSQFLGMLALIRNELEAKGIKYAYFDGSTSATERERAINLFQDNEDCRVFLISLKAGGIGLNLTAADYVYIVDPWWNPAVEQQAIDRTHRIGQTKNIFAYRLICKDTIEEKMLTLQERKRALATELVSDDNAFLKRLTKEDIAYLLS